MQLPGRHAVPTVRGYKYVQTRDEIQPVPRPAKETGELYRSLVAQVALLALRDLFEADPRLASIGFNGHVDAINPGTGQCEYPCLISLNVERELFAQRPEARAVAIGQDAQGQAHRADAELHPPQGDGDKLPTQEFHARCPPPVADYVPSRWTGADDAGNSAAKASSRFFRCVTSNRTMCRAEITVNVEPIGCISPSTGRISALVNISSRWSSSTPPGLYETR